MNKFKNNSFFTIDFETSNSKRYSACQVAINVTIDGEIVEDFESYIRPPDNYFQSFTTQIHGITPNITRDKPTFKDIYFDNIVPLFERYDGLNFMVAHNSGFDKSVFLKTLEYYEVTPKNLNWFCTHQAFRKLGYEKTKLNILCDKFGIPLKHHDAKSDTEATSKLYLEYLKLIEI